MNLARCYHQTKRKGGTRGVITVANRIYVTQEHADAFEQRFREGAGLVDQEGGERARAAQRRVGAATAGPAVGSDRTRIVIDDCRLTIDDW
jgi:Antibiotic biosynthesis monooxygenase